MSLLLIILIILLFFGGGVGYYGNGAGWGYAGWSPFGILLLILVCVASNRETVMKYVFAALLVSGFVAGGAAWAKGPPQSVLDRKACNALWVANRHAHPGKPNQNHDQFMGECLSKIQLGR